MDEPIQVQSLIKKYKNIEAVRGVSFAVKSGEIFGLIGPDGAGKTSILRIIVSLLEADSGEVKFMGRMVLGNAFFVRSQVGYMPQRFSLYQDLTVEENLHFFADLFNVSRQERDSRKEQMYRFSRLGPFARRRAGDLSGGMKQKLALSCMLMHGPEVIVLDEPTFGVDPVSRQEFWQILHDLAGQGKTILITTAYMDEAAQCDRIALIFEGRILAMDAPQSLRESYGHPLYRVDLENSYRSFEKLKASGLPGQLHLFGSALHWSDKLNIGRAGFLKHCTSAGLGQPALNRIPADIEDIFLHLMNGAEPAETQSRPVL